MTVAIRWAPNGANVAITCGIVNVILTAEGSPMYTIIKREGYEDIIMTGLHLGSAEGNAKAIMAAIMEVRRQCRAHEDIAYWWRRTRWEASCDSSILPKQQRKTLKEKTLLLNDAAAAAAHDIETKED
jgi:hypothetical protein